jgi:histidinol phosphatase-like PHP family hydrolase
MINRKLLLNTGKNAMIDLHTHTFASDGVLLPSELVRRAVVAGYEAIGLTDHADETNYADVIKRAVTAAEIWNPKGEITVIPGVELTHVAPERIAGLAKSARELGAGLVVVHGETITEPVAPGTNEAAAACSDVDIIAHPGLITSDVAALAAKTGVCLEITTRKGHSAANGRTAAMAGAAGARLVVNSDAHAPGDLVTVEHAGVILAACGLGEDEIKTVFKNSREILEKILKARQA